MNTIQHTFLVSSDIERWLKNHKPVFRKTEQFYVDCEGGEICYYHKSFPDTYTKVTVAALGDKESSSVTPQEYMSKRKKRLGSVIVKKSYKIMIGVSTFVVEKYLKKLKGIYKLIGYFPDEKAYRGSETIQGLQAFVLKEIDKDEKYYDEKLALYMKPMEYNLPRLFEKLDAFESPNLFFWQVPQRVYARDGVSLVLYRNIRLLNYYKVSFQNRHFASTLHRLRVLLRRTSTLLETFSDLYNPNVKRLCTQLLQRYYEETKVLRYLYFLNELYSTREDNKLTLYSELTNHISKEERDVTEMLLSQPFIQMMNMLTREVTEQQNQKYISLKREVKNVLREGLGKFEILLAQTKEGYDDEILEALYISMDTLQTLTEDFFHIIGDKKSQSILNELNILLKPLREYRNCKERAGILDAIKEHSENRTLDTQALLCEQEDALKDKITYALKLLRGSRFYI